MKACISSQKAAKRRYLCTWRGLYVSWNSIAYIFPFGAFFFFTPLCFFYGGRVTIERPCPLPLFAFARGKTGAKKQENYSLLLLFLCCSWTQCVCKKMEKVAISRRSTIFVFFLSLLLINVNALLHCLHYWHLLLSVSFNNASFPLTQTLFFFFSLVSPL